MADLKEKPVWEEGIYQLEEDDPVQAGEDGIDNRQAKQLANRTQWLKGKIEGQAEMLAEHASAVAEISDPDSGLDSKAPLKSPGFSGIPTVPTPSGDEPLQIVNTQYLADTLADGLLKFAQSNPESVERIKELLSAQRTDDKFAAVTGLVKALSDRINAARAQDVEMWPAQAVTDKNGRIAYGVTPQGDFYRPAATDCNSGTFPGWAVTDRRSRLMFGFDAPRGEMLLPGGSIGMNRNVSWAVGDKNGRTAVSLLPDGAVRFSGGVCDDSGIVWLEGGDVYRQRGGRTERITRRGDVAACRAHGQAIRYVAPRRGVFLTYEWRDGKTRQVFCSDANETDGFIVTGQSLAEGGANAAMSRRPAEGRCRRRCAGCRICRYRSCRVGRADADGRHALGVGEAHARSRRRHEKHRPVCPYVRRTGRHPAHGHRLADRFGTRLLVGRPPVSHQKAVAAREKSEALWRWREHLADLEAMSAGVAALFGRRPSENRMPPPAARPPGMMPLPQRKTVGDALEKSAQTRQRVAAWREQVARLAGAAH